jgi:hypothetical protein
VALTVVGVSWDPLLAHPISHCLQELTERRLNPQALTVVGGFLGPISWCTLSPTASRSSLRDIAASESTGRALVVPLSLLAAVVCAQQAARLPRGLPTKVHRSFYHSICPELISWSPQASPCEQTSRTTVCASPGGYVQLLHVGCWLH